MRKSLGAHAGPDGPPTATETPVPSPSPPHGPPAVDSVGALLRILTDRRPWGYGLFWSWNLIFLTFMLLGFAPQVLPQMVVAVQVGTIPGAFLAYGLVLTAIPAGAVALGATVLRRSPGQLLALGYGVEGPLMLVLGIRFFVLRDLNPAVGLLLGVAALGLATFLWQILDRRVDARPAVLAYPRVVGLTLLLAFGVYVGVWLAFYAVPLGAEGLKAIGAALARFPEFLRGLWTGLVHLVTTQPFMLPLVGLGTVLLVYTATLLVVMPIAVPFLAVRAWWRGLRSAARVRGFGPGRTALLALATLAACAGLFVLTTRQPQGRAFALLATPPESPAAAEALLSDQEEIRAGLLNAYLAPFRYLSATGEVRHVSDLYQWTLHLSPEDALRVERAYEMVARPVLYEPAAPPKSAARSDNRALREDPAEAARLYQAFFDAPITRAERETIVQTVRVTWSADQAEAAWQAVDDREVHLERQELTVAERGDWAEVELYEVYRNQTARRQEVVYYFSLPESAVVTGVWLGYGPDRAARFAYRVSPRGAAQAVYRNEVRRNVDPALLEQIGPRQYRLRAFPVEPRRQRWDGTSRASSVEPGPELHLWLTWRVLAEGGAWSLPRLAEKRNVYWDAGSVRLLNGQAMPAGSDEWLPASAPVRSPSRPTAHRVDFSDGVSVIARPVAEAGDLPRLASSPRLAVVLDRSRSMAERRAEVGAALTTLVAVADPAASDVYLTAAALRGEGPSRVSLAGFDPSAVTYYGGQNPAELLAQFGSLSAGRGYDAVLVLTDASGYELGDAGVSVPIPDAPVWMIHLGGDLPLGYDDGTLQAVQASGGGVVGSVDAALGRLALTRAASAQAPGRATSDLLDGYVWSTLPTADARALAGPDDDFAPFAARRLILATMQRERESLGRAEALDRLHDVARTHGVVTPYSSMIVLVEDRQHSLLDQMEARGDRFEREHEAVGETTPPSPPNVTGVPEPEEWLLIALAAALVVWLARSRRRASLAAAEP